MRNSLFILLFLFVAGLPFASAQVPGYQGKRLSVGYNASSFVFLRPNSFEDGIAGAFEGTRLSYKTELHVDYVLSRKVSAGFSYYFAKQKHYFTIGNIQNVGYYYPKKGIAPCALSIFEVNLKIFRKNFIAPAGLYHQFSAGMVKYKLGDKSGELKVYEGTSAVARIIPADSDPYTCFKLGYSIGKTNPIGHNFYINTAFGINFFRGGDGALVRKYEEVHIRNYMLANFNRNLRTQNMLEIKIGLGWLAF